MGIIKPLLSRSTTGEFNPPPKYILICTWFSVARSGGGERVVRVARRAGDLGRSGGARDLLPTGGAHRDAALGGPPCRP
eukprot:7242749-Pyramimonas_sp.AAC.1